MTERERLNYELDNMRGHIAAYLKVAADESKCRGCGATIYWLRHRNGKAVPYTGELLNHFIDCPNAVLFREKVKAG